VPLLVTDNLEGTLKSRSVDTLRQLSLAISFLQAGVAGNVGFSSLREDLESVLGSDINSLLTVGRITDNTIQVRLGAARQATAGYAMLPRSHNITLVLMVPNSLAKDEKAERREIRVAVSTTMRDAEWGTELRQQTRGDRVRNVEQTLMDFFFDGIPAVPLTPVIDDKKCKKLRTFKRYDQRSQDARNRQAADDLLYAVLINDYERFELTLDCAGWGSVPFKRDLWLEIAATLGSSEYAGARFELPRYSASELPNNAQAVLLLDDGKKRIVARLQGGKGLVPERIAGQLTLILADGTQLTLPAETVGVSVGTPRSHPSLPFAHGMESWRVEARRCAHRWRKPVAHAAGRPALESWRHINETL